MRMERDQIADMLVLGMNYEQYDAFIRVLTSKGKTINDHFRELEISLIRENAELKNCIQKLRCEIMELKERGCNCGKAE